MPGKYSALVLSRGEQFEPPDLIPLAHGYAQWPDGSNVYTVFYDSAGGIIAQIDGDVSPQTITFDVEPETLDPVPAGAQFETFLIDDDGKTKQIRYGQVIRKQAQFFNTPARQTGNRALQFRDNFYARTGLVGPKWFVTLGRPTIFDHSAEHLPNAAGSNFTFFSTAAMRYQAPLNTDSVIMSFSVLHRGAGDSAIILCSNAAMTSYLYVQFHDPGIFEGSVDKVRMGRGSGPLATTQQTPEVAHTVPNNSVVNYKLRYDADTRRLALLNSTLTTEIIGWTDEDAVVPHGPGYRYFGANFEASIFDYGFQLASISAQDTVNA